VKRIRNLSLAVLAALAVTAAVGAASASAAPEFAAGKYGATITSSVVTEQQIGLQTGTMPCSTSSQAGELGAQSKTLWLNPTSSCSYLGYAEPVKMNGCAFVLHPGVETSPGSFGGTFDISCPAGNSIEVGTAGSACIATIEPKTGLSASFQNVGSGSTATVKFTAAAAGLKHTQVSGKFCTPGTYENGTLTGSWALKATNGGVQTGLRLTQKGAISISGTPPKLTGASYPIGLDGVQKGTHTFSLQFGKATCEGVTFSSGPLGNTSELPMGAEYSSCLFAGISATVRMNNCKYVVNIENAGPPYTGVATISCIGGSKIEIVASPGKPKCTVTIGEQTTNAGGVSLTNEASTIGLGFSLTGLSYHQQKGEGLGTCTTGDFTTGTYSGSSILTGYL
jgi:hypothetical protein